jgi:hypothetical protein
MASKGRNGDSMLVHMAPSEVAGLQALGLSHGITMTINPHTGLPEAFSFKKLLKSALPMIAGFALGPAGFGVVSSALGAGALVGGATALATGSLQKGIMAGLGAYGGASLGAGLQSAGMAAAQQNAVSGLTAEQIAGRAAFEGLSEQGYKNLLAEQATKDYLSKGIFERAGAGISALGSDIGRTAALQGVGGASGLYKAGMAAALPVMADQAVQTSTPMPGGQYQGTIRPYKFDPFTKRWTAQPTYPAMPVNTASAAPAQQEEQPPGGMAGGGIVALADGGATREQVLQAYRANPGAELNPNEEAINYWMKQGLGSFTDVVNQTRAANPALAQQIDAARTAATTQQFATPANTLPNYLGLNAVAAGQPGGQTVISGTAGPGYNYAAATPQTDREKEINQIYRDVLGREAEREGLSYWANTDLGMPEIKRQIQSIGSNIGVNVDPTQLATPTAGQLAAQQSILKDPQAAAIGIARSGVAQGLSDQQIANLVNETYGKSFSAQNVADFMRANNITRPAPVTAVSPTFTGTDTGTTVTPAPLPGLPDFAPTTPTLAPATQFTPQTMEQVRTAYEQGGGATEMPTVTRLGPNERPMTQNAVVNDLQAYLANNPNATATEITAWGRANGVPDYQLRAAVNERRFNMLTGGSKSAYDYLMGRGPYSATPFVPGGGALMRPYSEVVGGAARESAIRRYVPPAPSRQTAQGADTSETKTTTGGTTTGGTTTTGGGVASSVTGGGMTGGGAGARLVGGSTVGGTTTGGTTTGGTTRINPETGTEYTALSGTPITDFLFGTQDASKVPVVDRGFYTDAAMRELLANEAALNASRAEVEDVLNVEQIQRDILRDQEEAYLQRQLEIARAAEDFGPFDSEYDAGGPNYTDEELDLLAGMRKGGLAAIAAGAARGGQFNLGGYSDGGRLLRGPGDGVSDSIPATIGNRQPARLADGEFVIPARIVSEIGNGSTEAGARKLYAMMDRVQRARAKTTGKGKVAKNTRADKYLPA